ncbi:MAG: iron-containing redox enzyme family protein [Candidatus Nitrosocaldus sp.]|nr:iron-containing redox enzyme family protein [Candidatus Nitrosocaldus sp.]MDW7999967.1 iron-containing redox enzyme family protein [Candidatus Nitrosocaldus sp.]
MGREIVERIDLEVERLSLLKHPFYRLWSEGRLSMDALRGYALEYFHLVRHVPEMVENVMQHHGGGEYAREIDNNLREEREHIALWIRFAEALGISREDLYAYGVSSKTKGAVERLLTLTSRREGVAAMYAYEAEIPRISAIKLDGLIKYYSMESKEATEYQRVHSVVDVRHADLWRRMISSMPEDAHDSLHACAVESMVAQNLLLDAVYERYIKDAC